MNKIGLKIDTFIDGPKGGLCINGGEWQSKVVDIRVLINALYGSSDTNGFITFMTFSKDGAYIVIARPIPGRVGDYTAAWIYIPCDLDVPGDKALEIVNGVKRELANSSISENRLNEFFSHEYSPIAKADYFPSSTEEKYARRDVGFYSLKNLIGDYRYQPEYSQYKAILINDDNDGLPIINNAVVDISTATLHQMIVLCPPVVPQGVATYLDLSPNPRLFDRPIWVPKGWEVSLLFKRNGFQDIRWKFIATENNQACSVPAFVWNLAVSRQRFKIFSDDNANRDLTEQAKISVNGYEIRPGQSVYLSEQEAKNAFVKIEVRGFEPVEFSRSLFDAMPTIRLKSSAQSRSWHIKLKNGHDAEMTISSRHLSSNRDESPLKGYSVEYNPKRLEYSNMGVWKERLIGFVAGLIVVLGIGLTFNLLQKAPAVKQTTTHNPVETPVPPGDTIPGGEDLSSGEHKEQKSDDLKKAIAYMDGHEKWVKDSLDRYIATNGLWDEMNNYEFDKIKLRASALSGSERFGRLIAAINENGSSKLEGHRCEQGDFEIDFESYIKKIKSIKKSNNSGGNTNKDKTRNTNPSTQVKPEGMDKAGSGEEDWTAS